MHADKTTATVCVGAWITRLVVLIGATVSCARPQALPDELMIRTLEFHPVMTSGKSTPFKIVSLVDVSGKDMSSRCKGSVCRNLRKGEYTYKLRLDQSGRMVEGKGQFYRSAEWVTVGLGVTESTAVDIDGTPLQGTILGLKRQRGPTWVKLQALYGSYSLEAPIDESGNFYFESVVRGEWLLLILQDDQLLWNKPLPFSAFSKKRIEIDLRQ